MVEAAEELAVMLIRFLNGHSSEVYLALEQVLWWQHAQLWSRLTLVVVRVVMPLESLQVLVLVLASVGKSSLKADRLDLLVEATCRS